MADETSAPRPVAVVADPSTAAELGEEVAATGFEARPQPPRVTAPLGRAYATAAAALVVATAAMPAAAAAQRLRRVPWLAVLDEAALAGLEADGRGRRPVEQAAAVLVPRGAGERAAAALPRSRVVERGDRRRLGEVLRDLAVSPAARGNSPVPGAALLADGWTFAGDRATRLAIRLMPLVGRSAEPVHPKHLVPAPWHLWYLDRLRPGDRVLDLGCAGGAHAVAAARVTNSVVGVDVDAPELERARERADRDGLGNVELLRADLSSPEALLERLEGQHFDAVLALDVLEHLDDRAGVLEAARALFAPGGRLFVAVPNRETPYKRWRRRLGGFAFADPDHKVEYTEDSLREELSAAGFRVLDVGVGGYDTPFDGVNALVAVASLDLYRRLASRRHRLLERHPDRAGGFRVVAEAAEIGAESRQPAAAGTDAPSASPAGDRPAATSASSRDSRSSIRARS